MKKGKVAKVGAEGPATPHGSATVKRLLRRPPPKAPEGERDEMGELFNLADDAIRRFISDQDRWTEERQRLNPAPLPWPLAVPSDNYAKLMQLLAVATVENLMFARAEFLDLSGHMPEGDETRSPDFQLILRIAKRAVDGADAEIRRRFGSGKLTGKRKFVNWLKAYQLGRLQEGAPGISITDASMLLGIGKSGAYRALKQKSRR
jgi:hypothetical protein